MKKSLDEAIFPREDIAALERAIERIAPLFDAICADAALGTPPAAIIESINAEARRSLRRRTLERKVRRSLRFAAAAAAVALVLGRAMHLNTVRDSNRREEVLNQLIVASDNSTLLLDHTEASMTLLAEMLMEMQGLDEDSYFNAAL